MAAIHEETYELNSASRTSKPSPNPGAKSMRGSLATGPTQQGSRPSRLSGFVQIPLAWLSAFLTLVFLTLTSLYASQTMFTVKERIAHSSESYAIFILRLLSEIAGVLLAMTVAAAFERVQWLLVVRTDGTWLTNYLALQAGTSVMGLLALTVGRGVSRVTTRLWSAIRLVSVVLIPALGVIIMSNVQIQLGFRAVSAVTMPLGFGMGPLNSTVAAQLSPLTDILFGAGFTLFLDDSNHAVDITAAAKRQKSCSQGIDVGGGQTCEREVFLVGGLDQVAPEVATVTGFPEAQAWLAENHQGYVLNFAEGNRTWKFENETDCRVYHTELVGVGATIGAFMLCVKNIASNALQARIVSCSYSDPLHKDCLEDTSWQLAPGWSTSLEATYRRASVAYSRLNATIISHAFTEKPAIPAPVDSSSILQAWDNFLGSGEASKQTLALFGLGYGKFLFPAMVGWFLNGVSAIAADNPEANTRGVNALQALLAIPLYFCQTGFTQRVAMSSLPSSVFLGQADALNITGGVERNSTLSLAVVRNEVFVTQATLVAYIALAAAAWIFCFVALCIGSLTRKARTIPDTTSFPALDFYINCVVRSPDGISTTRGPFRYVQGEKAIETMKLVKGMKVERAGLGRD